MIRFDIAAGIDFDLPLDDCCISEETDILLNKISEFDTEIQPLMYFHLIKLIMLIMLIM